DVAECAEEKELAESGFDEVGTANDFGDLHRGVVDGAGELVTGDVVFAPDEEVAEVAAGGGVLFPEAGVGERNRFTVGHAKAPVDGDGFAERRERGVGGRAESGRVD